MLVSLVESKSGYFKEKPWIEKALWDDWRAHLETEMLDWTTSNNALEMWEFFKNSLREATLLFIPFKEVTQHSKPFWCTELTKASKELKQLRRNFRYKSNHANLEKLAELFKRLLSEKASAERLLEGTGTQTRQRILGIVQENVRWKQFSSGSHQE